MLVLKLEMSLGRGLQGHAKEASVAKAPMTGCMTWKLGLLRNRAYSTL